MTEHKVKWYRTDLAIILFLILLWPVGVYFMWRGNWPKPVKIVITSVVAVFVLFVAVAGANTGPTVNMEGLRTDKTVQIEGATFTVRGRVQPVSAQVRVEDKLVQSSSNGEFSVDVAVTEGYNDIDIAVTDGEKTTYKRYPLYRVTAAQLAERQAIRERETEDKRKQAEQEKADKEKSQTPPAPVPTTPTPPAPTPAPAPRHTPPSSSGGVVKLSVNNICHAPGTTYYNQTKNYTAYPSLDACLGAGGRLPKR